MYGRREAGRSPLGTGLLVSKWFTTTLFTGYPTVFRLTLRWEYKPFIQGREYKPFTGFLVSQRSSFGNPLPSCKISTEGFLFIRHSLRVVTVDVFVTLKPVSHV